MSEELLEQQINALIDGTLSEAEHRELQSRLKSDPAARAIFRERMDLESGLRTWAANGLVDRDSAVNQPLPDGRVARFWPLWKVGMFVTAASVLVIAGWLIQWPDRPPAGVAGNEDRPGPQGSPLVPPSLGNLVARADCVWQQPPSLQGERFSAGSLRLASGAAELRFDSGTNVILEGPSELQVETVDSARLLEGTVFVEVTAVSNGFLLETPEARIVDEGTQYAVALDVRSTEIHVFDGNVIWTPNGPNAGSDDRIRSGEARRYLRSEPGRPHRVPFGQREFVRRIEERVRDAGGKQLIAYDGFENLAGQLRRGRSGFGWDGGWEPAGRGRGTLAEVIDAPDDVVFGLSRAGRRTLLLRGGDRLRRQFERPVELDQGMSVFVSLLVSRLSATEAEESATRILLEPDVVSPRFARRNSVSFGVASDGRPFVNNAGMIEETALSLPDGETVLLVFRYESRPDGTIATLRLYRPGETVDEVRPSVWTVQGTARSGPTEFKSIRLDQGMQPDTQVDELRIGYSWDAVVDLAN